MQEQNLELSNAPTINISPSLVSADNKQETEDLFGKSPQTFDKVRVRQGVWACVCARVCVQHLLSMREHKHLRTFPCPANTCLAECSIRRVNNGREGQEGDVRSW